MNIDNLYNAIGVDWKASAKDIEASYKKLRQQFEVRKENKFARERLAEIEAAYNVLSDTKKRKAYDIEYYKYYIKGTKEVKPNKEKIQMAPVSSNGLSKKSASGKTRKKASSSKNKKKDSPKTLSNKKAKVKSQKVNLATQKTGSASLGLSKPSYKKERSPIIEQLMNPEPKVIKKKKRRGWLFLIPILLLFALGAWLFNEYNKNQRFGSTNGQTHSTSSVRQGQTSGNSTQTTTESNTSTTAGNIETNAATNAEYNQNNQNNQSANTNTGEANATNSSLNTEAGNIGANGTTASTSKQNTEKNNTEKNNTVKNIGENNETNSTGNAQNTSANTSTAKASPTSKSNAQNSSIADNNPSTYTNTTKANSSINQDKLGTTANTGGTSNNQTATNDQGSTYKGNYWGKKKTTTKVSSPSKRPSTGSAPYTNFFGSNEESSFYKNRIQIKNTERADAIVCLMNQETGQVERNVYIRKGTQITLKGIPNGVYYIKSYYGNGWDQEKTFDQMTLKGGFLNDEQFQIYNRQGEWFKLEQAQMGAEIHYATYNVVLGKGRPKGDLDKLVNHQTFFNNY